MSYRFAATLRWLPSHVFVAAVVVLMVNLGFWQLRRLDERQAGNARVEARADLPVVAIETLDDLPQEAFRRVEATGTYQRVDEVLVLNRSSQGSPGSWVVTPLLLGDRTAVAVVRGFVPFGFQPGEPRPEADPPPGVVTVTGQIRPTQERGSVGPRDPEDGRLDALARVDVDRLAAQVDYPLAGAWLALEAQDPVQEGDLPVPVPLPAVGEGSHLSYAIQWFTFSGMTIVVYALILRRRARKMPSSRRTSS